MNWPVRQVSESIRAFKHQAYADKKRMFVFVTTDKKTSLWISGFSGEGLASLGELLLGEFTGLHEPYVIFYEDASMVNGWMVTRNDDFGHERTFFTFCPL